MNYDLKKKIIGKKHSDFYKKKLQKKNSFTWLVKLTKFQVLFIYEQLNKKKKKP